MTRAATRIRTVVVGAMAAGGSRKKTARNTCRDRVGEGLDRGSLTYIGRDAEADKRWWSARRWVTVRSRRRTARGLRPARPGSRPADAAVSGPAETTFYRIAVYSGRSIRKTRNAVAATLGFSPAG